LKCFASALWAKKEQELLKKMLVAEAYKEVTKFVLQDLDEESSLYKAI